MPIVVVATSLDDSSLRNGPLAHDAWFWSTTVVCFHDSSGDLTGHVQQVSSRALVAVHVLVVAHHLERREGGRLRTGFLPQPQRVQTEGHTGTETDERDRRDPQFDQSDERRHDVSKVTRLRNTWTVVDAVINVVSVVVFVGVLVWLMRQSRRSLVGWHSRDGYDFVAAARGIDESGTPTRWKIVRVHLDPDSKTLSLLPRGARSTEVRGSFRIVGRPHESVTKGLHPRHAAFVVRRDDGDVLVRVDRSSLPFDRITATIESSAQ